MFNKFRLDSIGAFQKPLEHWLTLPEGQHFLATQTALLAELLPDLFGYHLLQLGLSPRFNLATHSRISHRFILHPSITESGKTGAVASYSALPLASESVDVVLLHHVLDFHQDPHSVLREAARVVIPRGYLLVIGFNPWSLWGLCRHPLRLFSKHPRFRHRRVRIGRLVDWLKLLNFEVVERCYGAFVPPICSVKALKSLHLLERWGKKLRAPWGSYYIVLARKDIAALTPLRLQRTPATASALSGWSVVRIIERVDPKAAKHWWLITPLLLHRLRSQR